MCDKEAHFGGLCTFHRKKAVAGGLVEWDDGTLYDTCARGHLWIAENIRYEAAGAGAKKRRRCRQCLRIKAQSKTTEAWEVQAPKPVRFKDKALTQALASMSHALDHEERAKCADRYDLYTDYTAKTLPTSEMAEEMCRGCPFFQACANATEAERPGWGVRAGVIWLYGKPYDESRAGEFHEDD
jgi:hypothetical protein